jgi:predicted metal-dependent phosphoesterase TrpH
LVRLARAAGLDAVCLTEHDRTWTEEAVRALGEELDFIVLRGMEVTTELGHVLVVGLDAPTMDMYFAASLRERVLAADGLMFAAHPARAGQAAVDWSIYGHLFDAAEGLNGSDGPAQNEAALRLATLLPLPPTAGSDCHSPREAGTVATVLAASVRTERELIDELRRGRHRVVDLRALSAK